MWDARTQMPPDGARRRGGQQLATLSRLAQERFTSEQMGRLLDAAEVDVEGEDAGRYRVRAVRRRARPMPWHAASPRPWSGAWPSARPPPRKPGRGQANNDFARFAPELETMVRLNSMAAAIGYTDHPYDALLLQ